MGEDNTVVAAAHHNASAMFDRSYVHSLNDKLRIMDVHEEFYSPYLAKVPEQGLMQAFRTNMEDCLQLFNGLDEEQSLFRYAEGKWSIREILGHLTDAERVFAYRAMAFARGEVQALPGYDENLYAKKSNAHERSLKDHISEFESVRRSTILLFEGFDPLMFSITGTMSGHSTSVQNIGRMIVGHCMHHLEVLKELYVSKLVV
ncbi:MAG: DinB family protein [Flavobacteriales bacterium]|nr:DinB family protein [Flavobacteriales bacterium]